MSDNLRPDSDVIERAARVLALTGDYDGCFERLDTWESATPEQRECGEVEEPMLTDAEDAEWWRKRARALAIAGLLTPSDTFASAKSGEEAIQRLARAAFMVDGTHHFWVDELGRPVCLCGFIGSARKRTQTEHITSAVLEAFDHD